MRFRNYYHFLKIAFISILLLIALLIPNSMLAAGTAVVSVSTPIQTVAGGTQFTVNIDIQPNNDIAGVQFSLNFDPYLVTIDSVSEGDLLKQNGANTYFMPGQINNIAGSLTGVSGAIISPGQSVSGTGTFAVIGFTAKSMVGTCPLALFDVILGDINGIDQTVSLNNGQVVINGNLSPMLNAIGNKSINAGQLLTFIISGSDTDNDALIYSASNLPSGAIFDPSTCTFSWVPGPIQSGTYPNVHFEVTDERLIDSEDITITVTSSVTDITVLSPNGGENWNCGSKQKITWNANKISGYVKIELLKGDVLLRTLTSTAQCSAGTYSWSIPMSLLSGSDYRIRVTSISNPSVCDISDADFSINQRSSKK